MQQGAARHGRWRTVTLALCVCTALAACSPVYRNHGYVPNEEDLALVVVGESTRDTVAASLGRPSASGLLNDVGWFYVQSRWVHRGARAPQEIDRQVVAITFDEGGTVQNVERYGLEDGKVVALSRRVTKSNIRSITLISQLLSSFGRLRATQLLE